MALNLCCYAGREVGINFDDATKGQTKYMNVNLSHNYNNYDNEHHPLEKNTDVAMTCVGCDQGCTN